MDRRKFIKGSLLLPMLAIPAFAGCAEPNEKIVLSNIYSLWYNRSFIAETISGFCIGYINNYGEVKVAELSLDFQVLNDCKLFKFEDASDHGSPTIIRIPAGKHKNKILLLASNHASSLYCSRSLSPRLDSEWLGERIIDRSRVTYPAMTALPGGVILAKYTQQFSRLTGGQRHWRSTVIAITRDGGDSWSEPKEIINYGPGYFPYSADVAVSSSGHGAFHYSIYSSEAKRHQGLSLMILQPDLTSWRTLQLIEEGDSKSYVPYQLKWLNSREVIMTFSSLQEGVCALENQEVSGHVMIIDVYSGQIKRHFVIKGLASHNYPSGLCLSQDSKTVIYSPNTGGLIRHTLSNACKEIIASTGSFSSPHVFTAAEQEILCAVQNPRITTTRDFYADMLVMRL